MGSRLAGIILATGLTLAVAYDACDATERPKEIVSENVGAPKVILSEVKSTNGKVKRTTQPPAESGQVALEMEFMESAPKLQKIIADNGWNFTVQIDERGYSYLQYYFENEMFILSLPEGKDINRVKPCNLLFKIMSINPSTGAIERTHERKIFSGESWEEIVRDLSTEMPREDK